MRKRRSKSFSVRAETRGFVSPPATLADAKMKIAQLEKELEKLRLALFVEQHKRIVREAGHSLIVDVVAGIVVGAAEAQRRTPPAPPIPPTTLMKLSPSNHLSSREHPHLGNNPCFAHRNPAGCQCDCPTCLEARRS